MLRCAAQLRLCAQELLLDAWELQLNEAEFCGSPLGRPLSCDASALLSLSKNTPARSRGSFLPPAAARSDNFRASSIYLDGEKVLFRKRQFLLSNTVVRGHAQIHDPSPGVRAECERRSSSFVTAHRG